jgi:LysR family transcriptional regulator, carnitine catabolism transcriptional activator
MTRIDLSLRQLEAFTSIVANGGFRAAADMLHVSQPALSRTIQLAEATLGTSLFDRGNQGVELTPAGKQLLPIAQRILREFDVSRGELAEFLAGRSGRITLAVLPSLGVTIMPGIISSFLADFPAVRFSLEGYSAGPLEEAVMEGKADLGMSVRPAAGSPLHFEPLLADDFAFVCAHGDPLGEKEELPWSVFVERPFVATSPNSSIRTITDAVFARAELAVEPLYECNLSIAAALVQAGLGVSTFPRLAIGLIGQGGLVARKLIDPVISRQLGIITRPNSSLSSAATNLRLRLIEKCWQQSAE